MPGVLCPVLGVPEQEMDTLERVQQRMLKALEYLTYEERLRESSSLYQRREGPGRSYQCTQTPEGRGQREQSQALS